MATRHYTIISQGDDVEDLLPPAGANPVRRGRGRGLLAALLAVGVATLVALAVSVPLLLTASSRSPQPSLRQQPDAALKSPISTTTSTTTTTTTTLRPTTTMTTTTATTPTTTTTTTTTPPPTTAATTTTTTTTTRPPTTTVATTLPPTTIATTSATPVAATVPAWSAPGAGSAAVEGQTSAVDGHTSVVDIVSGTGGTGAHTQATGRSAGSLPGTHHTWTEGMTSDPAFVPATAALLVLLLLCVLAAIHAFKRRSDRNARRKNIGRMADDLQAGDKVTLMSSEED